MKLVNTSVKRPVGVIIIVLAVIALGIVSLRNLAVDLFPEIDLPVAVVATTYEDAASEDVEKLVSRPVEGAVSSVEGIEKVQSQSQSGSSLVMMMFKNGTDLDQALLDVREQTDQIEASLPEDAGDPKILRFSPDQIPVMYVSISGKSAEELTQLADDQLIPYFERQDGVASVTAEGATEREVQIVLKDDKMKEHGLDTQSVMEALNAANYQGSVGKIEKGSKDLQLRVTGEFTNIEDIRTAIIPNEQGEKVHVNDIATVEDTHKDQNIISLMNDKPSVVLQIMKKTDGNTVDVADAVRDSISDIEKELPADAKLDVIFDQSDFIKLSIDSVIQNILIGGAISVLVLLLFLKSFRATLVIGLSIPIAIISTFALMYFTGQTLNVLTLGGLALGLGMMVDSSIVILEHIHSYRQRGYSLFDAATKGASELAPAVIASTTTTLVVFLPIIYVEGIAADLFTPLALAVSFSLIASLVVAITLVPMLSSKLLSKVFEDTGRRYWFNVLLGRVNNIYQSILQKVLKFRKTSVLVTVLLIAGSLFLIPSIGAEFIPSSDQGQIQIDMETEGGSSLKHTRSKVKEINEKLDKYKKNIDINYTSIGGDEFGAGAGATNSATFMLELIPSADREKDTNQIVKEMDKDLQEIKGADITVAAAEESMSGGNPIQIELSGLEHEKLNDISEEVLKEVSSVKGVRNAETSVEEAVPQLSIEVDEEKASEYGLNEQQVSEQIRGYFNGQTATRYREAGHEMDVTLYYPEEDRSTVKDLEKMDIQSPLGKTVQLKELAKLEEVDGPVALMRQNQQPLVTVTSDIADRDLGSVVSDIKDKLDAMDMPEGYNYKVGGEAEDMADSFSDLAIALVFSIFLVYAVMAVQFENFLYPFIIMFAMPATVIGVIGGLYITNIPLSIPAFIGLIMLAGIVVNNSIILVDYINILRRSGMERYEAILHAGPSRLRPILMTTLTTILGMVPLALALGEGSETQQPLAVTIIFGLGVSTIFTLLFVPVVYTLLDDLSNKLTGKHKKKKESEA